MALTDSSTETRTQTITIPTWVTLSRLVGIPFIIYGLQPGIEFSRWWSVGIFIAIAATDWLDGYLARRLNQVTDLGKFLDPLVDKLMIMGPLLSLLVLGQVNVWGVFLILSREIAIAGWRVSQPKISGANVWGKLKTVSQIGAIAVLIAPLPPAWQGMGPVLFWVAVALTLISGAIYLKPDPVAQTPTS